MLLRLAALGALGFAGYKYLQTNGYLPAQDDGGIADAASSGARKEADRDDPHSALPGGPLSSQAKVIHSGDPLPAA